MVISVMLGKKLGHSEGAMAIPTCVLLTFHCVWFALFQRKTPDRNCFPTSLWFLWICFSLEMDVEISADCIGTSCYCTCINARLLSVELDVGFCVLYHTGDWIRSVRYGSSATNESALSQSFHLFVWKYNITQCQTSHKESKRTHKN